MTAPQFFLQMNSQNLSRSMFSNISHDSNVFTYRFYKVRSQITSWNYNDYINYNYGKFIFHQLP